MINGMVNIEPDYLVVRLQYPDGRIGQPYIAKDESDATRFIYFHNRLYITEKLKSWLNQRIMAYQKSGAPAGVAIANDLLLQLTVFNHGGLFKLCDWVNRHKRDIESIRPGQKSQHYKIYEHLVQPILEFCAEMEAVPV